MELSKGIIKADLIMAKQGLEKYKENTKIKDLKNMVAYHIQQAAEKMIKMSWRNARSPSAYRISKTKRR